MQMVACPSGPSSTTSSFHAPAPCYLTAWPRLWGMWISICFSLKRAPWTTIRCRIRLICYWKNIPPVTFYHFIWQLAPHTCIYTTKKQNLRWVYDLLYMLTIKNTQNKKIIPQTYTVKETSALKYVFMSKYKIFYSILVSQSTMVCLWSQIN